MNITRKNSFSKSEIADSSFAARALGCHWSVETHIDYDYQLSLVLLPDPDHPAIPSFILSGSDGGITAGMVANDQLENLGLFPSTDAAMARVRQRLTDLNGPALEA